MINDKNTKPRILVIDDEENIRFTFENFLSDEGYVVASACDYSAALAMINKSDFDLIFADIVLKGENGIDVLRKVRGEGINCPVVMITGAPDIGTASDAVRLGAYDYICKPVLQDTILRVTRLALRHKAMEDEKEKYRSNLEAIFKSVKDVIITVDKNLSVIEIKEYLTGQFCWQETKLTWLL